MSARLTEHKRDAIRAGGRKHAAVVHACFLCGRKCRGNGGRASHERACYKRHGLRWLDAEAREWLARFETTWLRAHDAEVLAVRRRLAEVAS